MQSTINAALRDKVQNLAEKAFNHHLISGYGDGEYPDKYQIVYKGKPRHLPLEEALDFLNTLLVLSDFQDSSLIEHT